MLKKFFILVLVLISIVLPAVCFSDIDIDVFEQAKYGKTYTTESLAERLNRLENDLFGMSQSGDLDSRLAKISQVIKPGININPNNIVYPADNYNYNMKPKKNALQRFWDNVTDTFDTTGTLTGYTPGFYSSGYGYNSNLYKDQFRNMFYNPQNYCPYNNPYYNRYSNNFPPINNRILRNQRLNPYYNGYYYNNPKYRNYNRIYYPPNIVTSSAVHILED